MLYCIFRPPPSFIPFAELVLKKGREEGLGEELATAAPYFGLAQRGGGGGAIKAAL